jgi:hypothetical protein
MTEGAPLLFPEEDMGVLVSYEQADLSYFEGPEPAPSENGARFELRGCRVRWPGRYTFDFSWNPPAGVELPVEVLLLPMVILGDIGLGRSVRVTLSGAGEFSVPVDTSSTWVRAEEGSREYSAGSPTADRMVGATCYASVRAEFPLVAERVGVAEVTLDPLSPLAVSPEGTVQWLVEQMDIADPGEPLLPLAHLLVMLPQLPFDRMYLILDGTVLRHVTVETLATCVVATTTYDDGTTVVQWRGCPPGRTPAGGPTLDDPAWFVAVAEGSDDVLTKLTAVPVNGAEPLGSDGKLGDVGAYLDAFYESSSATEVARFPFRDGAVSVAFWPLDGSIYFDEVSLFTGYEGGMVGRGGEYWNGCARSVAYVDGFAVVVVADPTWSVEAKAGGEWVQVDLVEGGGYGAGFLPGMTRLPDLRAFDTEGKPVACVAEMSGRG